MTIIKVDSHEDGGHDNQRINGMSSDTFPIPEGWALIPEYIGAPESLENYPFGEITVEDRDGVPTVTSWTPLPIPEPEGPEEPEKTYTSEDLFAAFLGLEVPGNAGGGDLNT